LDQLEDGAAPRALVLQWLAEARAFPTLGHYVTWLLDQLPNRWPFDLLPIRAAAQARRAMRGANDWEVADAVHDAVAETAFLLELVLLLNCLADETEREAELRCQLLTAQFRALDLEQTLLRDSAGSGFEPGTPLADRLEACRVAFAELINELATAESARHLLEARYLAGQPALFPGTAETWDGTRDLVRGVANVAAEVLGPIIAIDEAGTDRDGAFALASDLADRARSAALGLMGDSAGARAVASRRLRSGRRVSPTPPTS